MAEEKKQGIIDMLQTLPGMLGSAGVVGAIGGVAAKELKAARTGRETKQALGRARFNEKVQAAKDAGLPEPQTIRYNTRMAVKDIEAKIQALPDSPVKDQLLQRIKGVRTEKAVVPRLTSNVIPGKYVESKPASVIRQAVTKNITNPIARAGEMGRLGKVVQELEKAPRTPAAAAEAKMLAGTASRQKLKMGLGWTGATALAGGVYSRWPEIQKLTSGLFGQGKQEVTPASKPSKSVTFDFNKPWKSQVQGLDQNMMKSEVNSLNRHLARNGVRFENGRPTDPNRFATVFNSYARSMKQITPEQEAVLLYYGKMNEASKFPNFYAAGK